MTVDRKPITELKGHPALDIANLLIKEANWNENLGDKEYKTELVRNLTRQTPNRVYANPDGRVARVLFFSDQERPFQAYMETLDFNGEFWQRYRSQFLASSNPAGLEEEIARWRQAYGMAEDLLEHPFAVFEVSDRDEQVSEEYLHVVKTHDSAVVLHYFLGAVRQPYIINISKGTILNINSGTFRRMNQPPLEITIYANPFRNIAKQRQ
jgi:hypothetical protein